eukprot:scaffold6110_cov118-Isochrysis_galbana.AAC.5
MNGSGLPRARHCSHSAFLWPPSFQRGFAPFVGGTDGNSLSLRNFNTLLQQPDRRAQDRLRELDASEAVLAAVEHEPDAVVGADELAQFRHELPRAAIPLEAARLQNAVQARHRHVVLEGAVFEHLTQFGHGSLLYTCGVRKKRMSILLRAG